MPKDGYLFERTYALLTPKEKKDLAPWLKATLGDKQPNLQLVWERWLAGTSWEAIEAELGGPSASTTQTLNKQRNKLQEHLELYLAWLHLRKNEREKRLLVMLELYKRRASSLWALLVSKFRKANQDQGSEASREAYLQATVEQSFRVLFPSQYRKDDRYADQRWSSWLRWVQFELVSLATELELQGFATAEEASKLVGFLREQFPDAANQLLTSQQQLYQGLRDLTQARVEADLGTQLQRFQEQMEPTAFTNLHLMFCNYLIRRTKIAPDRSKIIQLGEVVRWTAAQGIWPLNRQTYRTTLNILGSLILLTQDSGEREQILAEALHYLEVNRPKLPAYEQDKCYYYCRANLYFAVGEYDKLTDFQLPETTFNDPYYDLGYRLTLVRADLNLGHLYHYKSNLHNLKQQTRRSQGLSEQYREGFLHYLNFLGQIPGLSTRAQAMDFKAKINQTQPLEGWVWLTYKADELIRLLPRR